MSNSVRLICKEHILNSTEEIVVDAEWKTFDVSHQALHDYLSATGVQRQVVGAEALDAALPPIEPPPSTGGGPVPPGPVTLLYDVAEGVPVDENAFGFSVLHAGMPYYTAQMTPEGGPSAGRMLFRWSRQFGSWTEIEKTPGVYTWSTVEGAAYLGQRGIHWVLVLTPVAPQAIYNSPLRGPAGSEEPYKKLAKAAYAHFWDMGMRAHEICNEPETENWYGSLGHKPANDNERRQTARELSMWARVAKEAANEYHAATGRRVEVWASASQSMANADPSTGLARVFNDPSAAANTLYGGAGFLNGPDGKGGIGAQWLDRFSFHGYPNPTHDGTLLHAHFLKAKNWLKGVGRESLPMVVTEHGVLSARNPALGDKSDGSMREWKTDNPYTGKLPAFSNAERCRWVLNAFAISAIHGARMIWYAWDERYMGIFGYANGPQGGSATAVLGWVPNHLEIEVKYKALREKMIGRKIFSLWKGEDGLLTVLVGAERASGELIALE